MSKEEGNLIRQLAEARVENLPPAPPLTPLPPVWDDPDTHRRQQRAMEILKASPKAEPTETPAVRAELKRLEEETKAPLPAMPEDPLKAYERDLPTPKAEKPLEPGETPIDTTTATGHGGGSYFEKDGQFYGKTGFPLKPGGRETEGGETKEGQVYDTGQGDGSLERYKDGAFTPYEQRTRLKGVDDIIEQQQARQQKPQPPAAPHWQRDMSPAPPVPPVPPSPTKPTVTLDPPAPGGQPAAPQASGESSTELLKKIADGIDQLPSKIADELRLK